MIKVFALIYASELILSCSPLLFQSWFHVVLAAESKALLHREYFALGRNLLLPAEGTVSHVSGCRQKQ